MPSREENSRIYNPFSFRLSPNPSPPPRKASLLDRLKILLFTYGSRQFSIIIRSADDVTNIQSVRAPRQMV